jgi:hypothetical protein
MTVVVSFITGGQISAGASGVRTIRAQERLTIPATTVTAALVGETVLIGNGEAGMVAAAFGSAPDAAATTATASTSAGMPIGAGMVGIPIVPGPGALVNVKAVP